MLSYRNLLNFSEKILKIALILSLFALVIASSILKVTLNDNDLWLHLKAGEYILQNKAIPKIEPFSYTRGGVEWVDHSWLFQIVVYRLYSWLGIEGLCLFRSLVLVGCFLILFKLTWKLSNYLTASILLFLYLMSSNFRFFLRPQLFTLLFTIIFLYILEGYREKRGFKIFWLIPLQWIWANLHGYFILGPLLIALYYLGEFWPVIVKFSSKCPPPASLKAKRRLLIVGLISLLVCLFNPNFLKGFFYPFKTILRFSSSSPDRYIIGELLPLSQFYGSFLFRNFWILAMILIVSFLFNFKGCKLAHLLICGLFFSLSLIAERHIDLFAACATVFTSFNLKNGLSYFRQYKKMRDLSPIMLTSVRGLSYALLTAIFFILAWDLASNRHYLKTNRRAEFGLGVREAEFPISACEFIEEKAIAGPMFNEFAWGGYLVWRFYPKQRVFIDGRTEVYSNGLLKQYMDIFYFPESLFSLTKQYDINLLLLSHQIPAARELIRRLLDKDSWFPVYFDESSIIFLKDSPSNRRIIQGYSLDFAKDIKGKPGSPPKLMGHIASLLEEYPKKVARPTANMSKGNFYAALGMDAQAEAEYRAALKANPDIPALHNNLANLLAERGLLDEAIVEFKEALRLFPRFDLAHFNLAVTYQQRGLILKAMQEYRKVHPGHFLFAQARNNLGSIYDALGSYRKAAKEFRRALKADPQYIDAHYNLGVIYGRLGMSHKAKLHIQKALKLNPQMKEAEAALRRLDQE